MGARPKPLLLAILDGWGHREARENNAIAAAGTPHLDALARDYPHGLINASERHVGLPAGQMGNSEVGHMNIGSGRVLMQELPRIDAAIAEGTVAVNPVFMALVGEIKNTSNVCHLLGLLSPGGVHSHQEHLLAMARLLAGEGIRVKIHAFLDGRDTPPQSAREYVGWLEKEIRGWPLIKIATVGGRYWGMDRDKRWDRVEKAYAAMTQGIGPRFASASEAVRESYTRGVTDEFIAPSVVGDFRRIQDGEGLLMVNFRADRVRQILAALLDPAFKEFKRKRVPKFCASAGMTEYSAALKPLIPALFALQPLSHILGEVISAAGLKQLRIAETEKYAHVTFFFNGGREQEFPGEERILVPSPKVATYDLQPEMSAPEVTEKLLAAIASEKFDFIVVNYANGDMVGHTGNKEAAMKAVKTVDDCIGKLAASIAAKGGALIVTADHGNAEMMFDPATKQAHTAHTLSLVPVIIAAPALKGKKIALPEGRLSDVAPTVLQLLNLPQPAEMTGRSLLE